MADKINIPKRIKGLTTDQVEILQAQFGINIQVHKSKYHWWVSLIDILKEPMLLLLFAVTTIYFILDKKSEAIFMLAALLVVSGISFYQDSRSRKALAALEQLNEPLSTVLRDGKIQKIPTHSIVVNDIVIAQEGNTINADGEIVHSNDFSVNESSLTGESFSVYKSEQTEDKMVYSGTQVVTGLAIYKVLTIGLKTKLGKLGSSLSSITEEPTPLQVQIEKFVKGMAAVGGIIFLLILIVYYWRTHDFLSSLLNGLTLAMAIIPEEIPVAFTTFMAIGSWRMIQEGIIVKKIRTVEALGSATVICTDKTGTLTENRMSLQSVYAIDTDQLYEKGNWTSESAKKVIEMAMWASEPIPFDPMEKTLHDEYVKSTKLDHRAYFSMIHEYPLNGIPPMMTHIFQNKAGERIIATKGSPEAIITVSNLSSEDESKIKKVIEKLAASGFRLLGVGYSNFREEVFPSTQQELPFHFVGLIAFYDPPKANIEEVIQQFYAAGIAVKVITGDNSLTTKAIATKAGILSKNEGIEGHAIMNLSELGMVKVIRTTSLFTRMFPEAKLAVMNALKKDNQIVAMVGDGVNDGPALKASHIGVAMGEKGTEIAKTAADMILVDDDLSKLVTAIAEGRRIYANIKKAVQYIISIHIPIVLVVSIPLFLSWKYPTIFTPIHVIFLELIMGPMCSIVYENEPAERNSMTQPPRKVRETFLSFKEMAISIVQGLVIAIGILFVYQLIVQNGGSETQTRTMVFTTLVFANCILSLVNRSFYYSVLTCLKNKNDMMLYVNGLTIVLLLLILNIQPIAHFFQVISLSYSALGICLFTSMVSVLWIELWKLWKRNKDNKKELL
jgi:Ca2+-transporting ATPase